MQSVNVRNLEQIQESDLPPRPFRLGALLLASLAFAAIAISFVVVRKGPGVSQVSSADPLAELLASAKAQSPAERLERSDVTFPGVLSDRESPTTALAAVKDERGRLVAQSTTSKAPTAPPPATDRLPVGPLPIGALLGATTVTKDPKDALTQLAADAARAQDDSELAPGGMQGGFQLQVASFKDPVDADRLVQDLRRRGHRAFRQAAHVPERGLWHRVRIGPFKSRFEADKQKADFERTERVSPFLIDPEKVKQAEQLRATRVSAERKRASRQSIASSK